MNLTTQLQFLERRFYRCFFNKINYIEFIIFLATACTSLRSSSSLCQILYSVEQNTFFNKFPILEDSHSSFSRSWTLFIFMSVANISSVQVTSLLNNNCCNFSRDSNNLNFRGLPLFFTIISDLSKPNLKKIMKSKASLPLSIGDAEICPLAYFRASASADLNFGAEDLFLKSFQCSLSKFLVFSLLISALKRIRTKTGPSKNTNPESRKNILGPNHYLKILLLLGGGHFLQSKISIEKE